MDETLNQIKTPYVDAQTLLFLFADYQKPRDHILALIKKKELIRLKNGFYLISKKVSEFIPYEQIANFLYGPSYVSLEWALSFYGIIPERVHTVTSMTIGRDKIFNTPVGTFSYSRLSKKSYAIGITYKQATDLLGGFLMATPEKALADVVYKTCKSKDKKSLKEELLESKRIDESVFRQLDRDLLAEIELSYRSRIVRLLVDLVGSI